MKQLNYQITNEDKEDWREKYDTELQNVVRTKEAEDVKPYIERTFLRVVGIGNFVQAIAAENKKIVAVTFEDNLLWFILDNERDETIQTPNSNKI